MWAMMSWQERLFLLAITFVSLGFAVWVILSYAGELHFPQTFKALDTVLAPATRPEGSVTRWMDSEGRIWERAENGTIRNVVRAEKRGGILTRWPVSHDPAAGTPLVPDLSDDTSGALRELVRITAGTGFIGFGMTQPQCPVIIHADDGREACLDWHSGTVTISGDLPVDESARLFVEALSKVSPWPPRCIPEGKDEP